MKNKRRCQNCGAKLGKIKVMTEKPNSGDFVLAEKESGEVVYIKCKWKKKRVILNKNKMKTGIVVEGVRCRKCGTYHKVYHTINHKFILRRQSTETLKNEQNVDPIERIENKQEEI